VSGGIAELLQRGRKDVIFFAEGVLGVKINRAQRRWLRTITKDDQWAAKLSVHVSANQTGKSLGVAILIIWATVYKIGVPTDDPEKWQSAPYNWFHVAPEQEQAYIPLRDIRQLVKGAHPAQEIGSKKYGLKCRFPAALIVFEKHEHYYEGFTVVAGGATAQFRTTANKADALQGRRAAGISFDEAAFEDHLIAVINETLMMRLISTGGPLVVVSTPDGMNEYYELVENIRQRAELVPNMDGQVWISEDGWALVQSVVTDNEGFGLDSAEIERMERDLDPTTKEQQLRGAFLEPSDAFFVPTHDILKAFRPDLHLDVQAVAVPGHTYIIFWDPSVAMDPTAAYALDVTKKPWKVRHEVWERKPRGINSLIPAMYGLHTIYQGAEDVLAGKSRAMTGYDETGMGGKIVGQQLSGLRPKKGIDFSGSTKAKLDVLMNLKAALLDGSLEIPDECVGLKREVLNYRLVDKDIQQDRVMALAGAAWLASKGFAAGVATKFDPFSPVGRSMWR
jgi:hypothetical protein